MIQTGDLVTGCPLLVKSSKMNNVCHIITTGDGSHTIYVPGINDHYHSVYGAVQESEYIFIRNGFDICMADPVTIFEVGFGTGLNALLTATRSTQATRRVLYTSIEKYPLDKEIILSLNHHLYAGRDGEKIRKLIHQAEMDTMTKISNYFSIRKLSGDIITDELNSKFDLIYFDAFGPDKQPEMWSLSIFEKISGITKPGGILVTYSAKGEVKRNLRRVGFDVSVVPGPPGKRHMMRAIKI